jgi:hypothetical protein
VLALALSLATAAPLEIEVADPNVVALVLECADGTFKAVVKDGLAVLERKPESCAVNLIRRAGTINEPGRWVCDLNGCRMKDVYHRAVENADGRINIIMANPLPGGSWLELVCSDGGRSRSEIVENTGVFDGVPANDGCTLMVKGGAPLRFKPLQWGTYQCTVDGNTINCIER